MPTIEIVEDDPQDKKDDHEKDKNFKEHSTPKKQKNTFESLWTNCKAFFKRNGQLFKFHTKDDQSFSFIHQWIEKTGIDNLNTLLMSPTGSSDPSIDFQKGDETLSYRLCNFRAQDEPSKVQAFLEIIYSAALMGKMNIHLRQGTQEEERLFIRATQEFIKQNPESGISFSVVGKPLEEDSFPSDPKKDSAEALIERLGHLKRPNEGASLNKTGDPIEEVNEDELEARPDALGINEDELEARLNALRNG